MTTTEVMRVFQRAMVAEPPQTVRFQYVDARGQQSERHVEPYEFRGDQIYCHDLDKGATRIFRFDSISDPELVDDFRPRYPIKFPA